MLVRQVYLVLGRRLKKRLDIVIAHLVSEMTGTTVGVGRYCHLADSYHIDGSNLAEFEGRFLSALEKRSFEQRTMRYEDLKEMMLEAREGIREKARKMARGDS